MSSTVLVVDDSLTVRMDLREAFERAGLEVEACATLEDARRALAGRSFGLVVLDVLLPDGSGIALLEEIRRSRLHAGARVMVLSTQAAVGDRVRGLAYGADEYLGKPYDRTYLVTRAKQLLAPEVGPTGGPRSILVVDGDAGFHDRLVEALQRAGYRALGAASGEEGLHIAAEERPDAVIVAAVLPGMDGATVVRNMKLDAGLRQIPALVVTGWNRPQDEVGALESGADAFARKEGGEDVILARLAVMLRSAERPAATVPSAFGPKRILVVDDSLTYLAKLSAHLRGDGYEVVAAHSGQEALDLLRAQPVDCVLLDSLMPGLSGHETARRIRACPEWRRLPVILLTSVEESREGVRSGADDFVNKSSELEVIAACVRAHLRRHQLDEENLLGREQLVRQEAAGRLLAAVVEEKERLSSLIEGITDEIWFADAQGRFMLMNAAASREFRIGGPAIGVEELAANLEVFRPDGSRRPVEESPPLRALRGETVRDAEEIIRTPASGELRHRLVSASPVRDAGGRIVGSVSVVRDVTERKKADEQIRRRNVVLAGIARIFEDALGSKTEEQLGETCLAVAEDATQSRCAFLGELNRQTGLMDDLSVSELGWEACGLHDGSGHRRKLRAGLKVHGLYGRVLRERKGFFTNDPATHPDRIGTPPGHLALKAFLGVPLLRDGDLLGMVGLGNREAGYGPEELEIAEALAPAIVQAFVSKRADQELRASEARFRMLFESTSDGVCLHALDGVIRDVNDAYCALSGYPRDELVGMPISRLEAVESPEEVAEHIRALVRGSGHDRFESKHRRRDGSVFDVDVTALHLDREGGRIAIFVRDISKRKRTEAALRDALERLVEADRRKNEFLGMLSHELRNPLAPIRNSVYVLEHAAPGSQEAQRAGQIIRRQTEHLTRLVDDLLDVTRIARGRIEIHPALIDLGELVRRACDDHRTLFREGGLEVRVEAPGTLWVDADETRIAQVIGNLLQNAARFGREDGNVTVSVGAAGRQVRLSVRDDGIGIAPELLPKVFEPFVQGDGGLARSRGGLGLGLALVKGLVDLHAGTVSARSEGPGRGSEFVVELPLAAAPPQAGPADQPPVQAGPLRILIVEDNEDEAASLAAALKLVGHRVEIARDGPAGLAAARSLQPDVVICDVGLPGMDGYEVARAMRRDPALAHVAMIAVTGYARPEDVDAARAAGFDHHIPKPASIPDLEQAMRTPPGAPGGRQRSPSVRMPPPVRTGWLLPQREPAGRRDAGALELEAIVRSGAHDLRAPLRHVEAYGEALLHDCGAGLGDVGRQEVARIQRAAKRAQEIVDDLVTLWRATSAELTVTTADLSALARQILADLHEAEPGRRVETCVEEGVTAQGDAALLQLLLQNLLGNAWKFTAKRPSARIEFGRAATPGGTAHYVRDDGDGFDAAHAGKLFEPFQRLHSKDEFEGTGLGLHLVKRVAERHGGRAWIDSAPGSGTTVYFTLGREEDGAGATAGASGGQAAESADEASRS